MQELFTDRIYIIRIHPGLLQFFMVQRIVTCWCAGNGVSNVPILLFGQAGTLQHKNTCSRFIATPYLVVFFKWPATYKYRYPYRFLRDFFGNASGLLRWLPNNSRTKAKAFPEQTRPFWWQYPCRLCSFVVYCFAVCRLVLLHKMHFTCPFISW